MAVSCLSPRLYWFLNLGVCQLYPGYRTFLYLYGRRLGLTKTSESTVLKSVYYAHHFIYWGLYLLYSYLESLFPLHKVVPFYYELKLVFFFWLGSDHFKGAGYLFQTYLRGYVGEVGSKLANLFETNADEKTKGMVSYMIKNLGTFSDLKESGPIKQSGSSSSPRRASAMDKTDVPDTAPE